LVALHCFLLYIDIKSFCLSHTCLGIIYNSYTVLLIATFEYLQMTYRLNPLAILMFWQRFVNKHKFHNIFIRTNKKCKKIGHIQLRSSFAGTWILPNKYSLCSTHPFNFYFTSFSSSRLRIIKEIIVLLLPMLNFNWESEFICIILRYAYLFVNIVDFFPELFDQLRQTSAKIHQALSK